jgi:hypothetical protein
MATEREIIDAVNALGMFAKVRYLVAEADADNVPTDLPLCILADGGRDYTVGQSFCGTSMFAQTYDMTIFAKTAQEVRSLSQSVQLALAGIAVFDASLESYDPDLRAFVSEITLS